AARAARLHAQALLAAGRSGAALRRARAAVALDARAPQARALVALALAAASQPEKARTYARRALAELSPPAASELLLALARIDLDRRRASPTGVEQAIRPSQAARHPPRVVAEAYLLLGRIHYAAGRIARAAAAFGAALRENPHHPQAHYFEGLLLIERERLADARRA